VKELNSLQSSFSFSTIEPITNAAIGEPDLDKEYYSTKRLLDILKTQKRASSFEYTVAFTHIKVTNLEELPLEPGEKAYFAECDLERSSVISLNRQILKYNSPAKNHYQFAAYLTICELLLLISRNDIIHEKKNYCLFDDCVDRDDFDRCIEEGKICESCLANLKGSNVSNSIISDATKILAWCKRNSLNYAIKETVTHPLTSLMFGTVAGWIVSLYLKENATLILVGIMLMSILFVFVNKLYFSRNSK